MVLTRDERLKSKVAIVTGAGSRASGVGNGRATAILLARSGARVTAVDVVAEWLEETMAMIRSEGGKCEPAIGNVASPADCEAIVADTVKRWGRIDILVNNVGIDGPAGSSKEVDPIAWDEAMRVNVTSMMLMTKYVVPEMEKTGGGAIVNLSSTSGLVGGHHAIFYPTSKGAIVNMTRAMAAHHGPSGIRVNCIAPGTVYTPMVTVNGMTPEAREARRNRSLLKTEGTGWDVGHAVRFLASDEARWITGAILPVDGGAMAGLSVMNAAPAGTLQR